MQTTLNKIKQHSPCSDGWQKLLTFLNKTEADDELLELTTILESNGLDDALWSLRTVDGKDREIRLMACDFAESVVHLANDERCNKAIDVSRKYANGEATQKELDAARAAAWAAVSAAARDAVSAAARAAARAARDARDAAMAAVSAAARDAARAAADNAELKAYPYSGCPECGRDDMYVDKKTILNAYPENFII